MLKVIKASDKLNSKEVYNSIKISKIVKIIIAMILILLMFYPINVQANVVEYNGEEGLIAAPNDFFLNLDELLPGDTKEDVAYIKNTTDSEIEVFFKTEPLDKTEYYDDIDYSLLQKIKLKISIKNSKNSDEKILYDGNLGAELMNNYVSLGKYTKNFDGEFKFKLEVPTDLRNDYTLSTTKVKWVFAVNKTKDSENTNNDDEQKENDNEQKENNNKSEDKNSIEKIFDVVKTGDNIIYLIGLLVICIIMVIILIIKNKKQTKDKSEINKNQRK